MLRFILLTGIAFNYALVFGQNIGRINFTEVRQQIEDSLSGYYYPDLLERIWADDSTLGSDHYRYLYYGAVFQDTYHPYGNSFAKKEFNEVYRKRDHEQTIEKGRLVLAENPVDIEVTLKVLIAYLELGDTSMARIYGHKYYGFLDAIYASGDGETPETAYVVISVDDEYRIVGDLGLQVRQQVLINDCDLLIFVRKGQRKVRRKIIKQLYFNVQVPLMSLSSSFKDADLPDPDDD